MNVAEIINKKANNVPLSTDEINYIMKGIDNYVNDYQLSAFLMTIKINGFNDEELLAYTDSIINSGKKFPLNNNQIDKHSTGGVGDKVSLILLPFFSIENIKFIKFSGRGLGFTGGTIDKLESIANLKTNYSYKEILESKNNLILSSADEFAPFDKKTYLIRDTSGSIDSWALIAASVMSKKIISGAKNIFIDIKVGSGAFLKNLEDGKELIHYLKLIAKKYNRNIFILFTDMNQPLGYTVGNTLEIEEVMDFFKGNYEKELGKLIEKIVSISYAKIKNISLKDAKDLYYFNLKNKNLTEEFLRLLENQNGDISKLRERKIFNPNFSFEYKAKKDGYLKFLDISKLGYFLIDIKAGRKNKEDKLYYDAGIKFNFKHGDFIKKGDIIFTIFSENKINKTQESKISNFLEVSSKKIKQNKIILGEILW
ncbi:MAG: thymidine phosphorylase [Candidatus Hepatoplasma vulgare]|nr:MAG: thymidine phosphorylase [Candidatus Hepatoplasma sp.]